MNRIIKKILKIDVRIVMLLSIIMIVFTVHQFLNNLLKSYEKAGEIKEGLSPNEDWYFQNPASIHPSIVKIREQRLQDLKEARKNNNIGNKIVKFIAMEQTESKS